ncbi:O-antigen ligase family protein [Flavobacterium sp.]|uniref:O-antigen ligase family protein n=1 Tax=Flavobacterium sp. TaxID=239 RepID=UPI002633947F|nr:O-antigen ligase family protein [Flavobacterium sp.]MDG2433863.1 O-antigen ligase family protein [Flavobacterium sp.]
MGKKTTQIDNRTEASSSNNNYFEIITLLFVSSILLIDFFPQFGSIEIIAPQYLYLSLLNILVSFFIFRNPELLTTTIKTIFQKSMVFKSYVAFLFICLVSVIMAANFSLGLISFIQLLIIFCTFVNLSLLLHNRLHIIYQICFIVGISLFVQSYLAISHLFEIAKSINLSTAFSFIQGKTGNINIFAATLTGKLPFLMLGIYHFSKWKKWFLMSTMLLVLFVVFLTASRASYIALVLNFIGFISILLVVKTPKKDYLALLPYIILPLIIAFLGATLTFKTAQDKGRFSSVTDRFSEISPVNSKDGSINIRLQYWNNALEIAKENPVFGVGLGNWKIQSQPYEKELVNNLTLSDHPHNDFLEIAAETGFINLIIYLSLFIFGLITNVKKIISTNELQSKLIALLALLLLISYGIDAIFNFPLYRATMQINFCLFLVLTIINTKFDTSAPLLSNKLALVIASLSIICFYFSYQTLKAYQFENETVFDLQSSQPKLRYDDIIDRIPKFPNTATNSQPYIEVAAVYAFNEKKYEQSIKYFNQSININPYTGRAEWYKYRIFKEQGIADSARYNARKAFEIRPRNQDYFLSALVVDAKAKDTAAILKNHNTFIKYVKDPSIWINTSSALAQSLYPNDKILKFMSTGLAIFPKDSTLLARLKSFEKDAEFAKSSSKNNSNGDNVAKASQYAANSDFEKAIVFFKKAAIDDPKNIIITQNIGICYFQLKQFKTAITYLEKTVNSPLLADGKTEFLLGAAYLNTNNKPKGCKFLILAENKNYPGAAALVSQYCN